MSEEFKAITTQEEFDKAIQKRLAQKDREAEEKYRDYLAPDKVDALKDKYNKEIAELKESAKSAAEKIAGFDKEKADLLSRATSAETALLKGKVANKHKIPFELSDRLVGKTEEELEKDAENFAGLIGPQTTPPQFTRDTVAYADPGKAATDAAYQALLSSLSNTQ